MRADALSHFRAMPLVTIPVCRLRDVRQGNFDRLATQHVETVCVGMKCAQNVLRDLTTAQMTCSMFECLAKLHVKTASSDD